MDEPARLAARRDALAAAGAGPAQIDELLAYTANPFAAARLEGLRLPMADEPHVAAWQEYAAEARDAGVLPALARRLVQLRFPIASGISRTEPYLAATRRGILPADAAPLALEDPGRLSLVLHATAAGRVPVLTAWSRRDFVTLVQACSCRNEPDPVPDSMGACIVAGLNNWDRVARHRRQIEVDRGAALTEAEWAAELKALGRRKELYQDRFILLSRAPYSAVAAAEIGLPDDEWRARSVAIRLEHECTHYFTLRAFGMMRSNLLDELIADFAGLGHAFGCYRSDLFLRFLGLEDYPRVRQGGRVGLYLGTPPLSAAAAEVVLALAVRASRRLEAFTAGLDLSDVALRARLVAALAGLTLEELAADEMPGLLGARLSGGGAPSGGATP